MNLKPTIEAFWQAVAQQDESVLFSFFMPEASVAWPNTGELFSVPQYVAANCKYPGDWSTTIEKLIDAGDFIISVTRVINADDSLSFYAVSFFEFHENKILSLTEYWGDIAQPPPWRTALALGHREAE